MSRVEESRSRHAAEERRAADARADVARREAFTRRLAERGVEVDEQGRKGPAPATAAQVARSVTLRSDAVARQQLQGRLADEDLAAEPGSGAGPVRTPDEEGVQHRRVTAVGRAAPWGQRAGARGDEAELAPARGSSGVFRRGRGLEDLVARWVESVSLHVDRAGAGESAELSFHHEVLGGLGVDLRLDGRAVSARLSTRDASAARTLTALRPSLAAGLHARGLVLARFDVEVRR